MSLAILLDVEEELKAYEKGECLSCRVGATHKHINLKSVLTGMNLCDECGWTWKDGWFYNCPVCHTIAGYSQINNKKALA